MPAAAPARRDPQEVGIPGAKALPLPDSRDLVRDAETPAAGALALPHEAGCRLAYAAARRRSKPKAPRRNGTPVNIVTKLAGSGTVVGITTADWLKPSLTSTNAVDLVSPGEPMPQVSSFLNVNNVERG